MGQKMTLESIGRSGLVDTKVPAAIPERKLRVAFVIFITELSSSNFREAVQVHAFAARKAAKKSKHNIDVLALVPESFPSGQEALLLDAGFQDILRRPRP